MIDLYYWPTPNGQKITMFLEEAGLARPATVRAYAKGEPFSSRPTVTEEGKKLLFGQTAANLGTARP